MNLNLVIKGRPENKSHWSIWGDSKTIFWPEPGPKMSQIGPYNVQNDSKLGQSKNSKNDKAFLLQISQKLCWFFIVITGPLNSLLN